MKINAKLGGVNSLPKSGALEKLVSAPFMVMGADVGHPAHVRHYIPPCTIPHVHYVRQTHLRISMF
ncbi:hypothetical protein P692DRAFT_20873953 [Suillus brevipes Sb2]|nr:hypothetical protein P692DRAFT_20873953 [Suillus brevipes Sb2]